MISRVWQYSFAQAKTKAMNSQLLTSEDWHYLLRMRSLENIVRYLSGTIYGQVLSKLSEAAPNPKVLVLTLYKGLFLDYAKLLKTVPARGAKLLSSLLWRYEAENLKTLLRAIWSATPIVKTRSLLYPLDFLSNLPVDALIQAPQVIAAIELLKKTVFFTPLMQALPQFQAQGRLFPLEIALDMWVFEHIARTISSLKGLAYKEARVLLGELIDWVNINWVIRFRHFYGLSPEETINYSLPGGAHLGLSGSWPISPEQLICRRLSRRCRIPTRRPCLRRIAGSHYPSFYKNGSLVNSTGPFERTPFRSACKFHICS